MRTRYTIKEPDSLYFITCTVVKWIPIFTRKPYFDILMDALQFCRQHKGLRIYAYAILDNHRRLVVAGPKLADTIRDFIPIRIQKVSKRRGEPCVRPPI